MKCALKHDIDFQFVIRPFEVEKFIILAQLPCGIYQYVDWTERFLTFSDHPPDILTPGNIGAKDR